MLTWTVNIWFSTTQWKKKQHTHTKFEHVQLSYNNYLNSKSCDNKFNFKMQRVYHAIHVSWICSTWNHMHKACKILMKVRWHQKQITDVFKNVRMWVPCKNIINHKTFLLQKTILIYRPIKIYNYFKKSCFKHVLHAKIS